MIWYLKLFAPTILVWGALALVGHQMTYFPTRAVSAESPEGAEELSIATPDGERLHAWWYEKPASKLRAPLATLYLHGNIGHLGVYANHLRPVRQAGTSVLIIDYRGFGRSTGSPNEAGLYLDAQAGYDWLRERGYQPHQIIVQGLSLGTAVAVELATKNPVGGLVLEAPFTSARAVAAFRVPVIGWTLPLGYDSIGKIPALRAPLLVMHGDQDRIIDPAQGRELYAAAAEPKEFLMVPGAGHQDLPMVAGVAYTAALQRLYSRCCQ